jgi:hypothetical protein
MFLNDFVNVLSQPLYRILSPLLQNSKELFDTHTILSVVDCMNQQTAGNLLEQSLDV